MGGAGALLILAGLFALYKRRKYQKQYAREQRRGGALRRRLALDKRRGRRSCRRRRRLPANLVDDNRSEADFEEWDYADETMGDEAKERPLDTPSPRRNAGDVVRRETKRPTRRWRPDGSAFVKWSKAINHCPC